MAITHAKVSGISDSGDANLVQPSDWNASHTINLADYNGSILATAINFGDENLDAYEDAQTWTPALTFDTPGDLSVAYSTNAGWYTRVGSIVTIHLRIVTSTFTHTTASGSLFITGIPFTSIASMAQSGAVAMAGWTNANIRSLSLVITSSGSTARVLYSRSGNQIGAMDATDMPTGGTVDLYGSCTFEVT